MGIYLTVNLQFKNNKKQECLTVEESKPHLHRVHGQRPKVAEVCETGYTAEIFFF